MLLKKLEEALKEDIRDEQLNLDDYEISNELPKQIKDEIHNQISVLKTELTNQISSKITELRASMMDQIQALFKNISSTKGLVR